MSKNKKRGVSFWAIYLVFVALFIGFWVWFLNAVIIKDLKIYEACQSEVKMEEVVEIFKKGDLSRMDFQSSSSRFEDGDIYKDSFLAGITGKNITFAESAKSYDTQAPIYEVFADDKLIATVNLSVETSEPLMFILAKQTWKVDSVVPIYETGNEGLVINMPDNYKAFVNGIEIDERELVTVSSYDQFKYSASYVTVPSQNQYKIEGLMTQPAVKIVDENGVEVPVTVEGTTYTAGFVTSEISAEMSEYVMKNAKTYSNFFSRDLAGCDNSINGIRYMFPEDSDYLTLAENYRLHDMWMFSGHSAPVFDKESVSNYIVYSPEFFSVEIYFEKSYYLTRTGDTRLDVTHSTVYYVLVDGNWVIADMIDVI